MPTLIFTAGNESFSVSEDVYLKALEIVSNFPQEKEWVLVNREYLKNLSPTLNSMICGTQWEEKLHDCDFQLAREEIASMIKMQNQEAQRQGGEYIWKSEVAKSIERFLAEPNLETAAQLLNCAPAFENYFEGCKPNGQFAFYKRMLRK